MRTLLLAGATVALLAGSALAQEQGGQNQDQNMNEQMQNKESQHPNATRQRSPSDEQNGPRSGTIMRENPQSRNGTESTEIREQGGMRAGARLTPTKSLPAEQRTRIRETIINSGRAPRIDNLNFSVRVGVAIPRSIRVVPVPEEIVSIYPEWNGFLYFVSGDEIIVVDPNSYAVVGVLEA